MAPPLKLDVIESAATWFVDLHNAQPGDTTTENHRRWLDAHPDHRRAWARVEKLQQSLQNVPAGAGNALLNARTSRRQAIKALSLLLATGGAAGVSWQQRATIAALSADYATATGERQQHTLADGSQIALNTASRVDVAFDKSLRRLTLHQGEMLVSTAKDAANRPFIVHTPQGSVRALGTKFTVFSNAESTRVNVLEHAVEIRPAAAPDAPLRLEAGQQSHFSPHRAAPAQPLPAHVDAWTNGLLIVSDWSLAHFVAELARYRRGYLACDATVGQLRISGAFQLDNTDAVLDNLASTLPVQIRQLTRYWVRVQAA